MERQVWMDRSYGMDHPYRVRELIGTEIETLGTFATRVAAERFLERLLAGIPEDEDESALLTPERMRADAAPDS